MIVYEFLTALLELVRTARTGLEAVLRQEPREMALLDEIIRD